MQGLLDHQLGLQLVLEREYLPLQYVQVREDGPDETGASKLAGAIGCGAGQGQHNLGAPDWRPAIQQWRLCERWSRASKCQIRQHH